MLIKVAGQGLLNTVKSVKEKYLSSQRGISELISPNESMPFDSPKLSNSKDPEERSINTPHLAEKEQEEEIQTEKSNRKNSDYNSQNSYQEQYFYIFSNL